MTDLLPPIVDQDTAQRWRENTARLLDDAIRQSPGDYRAIVTGAVCAVMVEYYRCSPKDWDTAEILARWEHMGAAYLAQAVLMGLDRRCDTRQ